MPASTAARLLTAVCWGLRAQDDGKWLHVKETTEIGEGKMFSPGKCASPPGAPPLSRARPSAWGIPRTRVHQSLLCAVAAAAPRQSHLRAAHGVSILTLGRILSGEGHSASSTEQSSEIHNGVTEIASALIDGCHPLVSPEL